MDEKAVITRKPPKSPAAAGILSAIFPGTGALYNGQIAKGIFYMILFAGLITIQASGGGQPFKALLLAGFYVFQIIDSAQIAKAINLSAAGEKPAEAGAPGLPEIVPAGSIFWGAVLIALGGLLILANFDVIRYETLFDFWPVAVIAIGLKLVTDSMARKKNGNGN
jgi:TM2 domain-containing membrane protein YozV